MPLTLSLTEDEETAYRAAREVNVTYTDQKPPILTIDDAIKQNSFHPDSPFRRKMVKGDAPG